MARISTEIHSTWFCAFGRDVAVMYLCMFGRSLAAKTQDEAKALELCRNKVRQRKLPMEVVDAEYQWCA